MRIRARTATVIAVTLEATADAEEDATETAIGAATEITEAGA